MNTSTMITLLGLLPPYYYPQTSALLLYSYYFLTIKNWLAASPVAVGGAVVDATADVVIKALVAALPLPYFHVAPPLRPLRPPPLRHPAAVAAVVVVLLVVVVPPPAVAAAANALAVTEVIS